MDNKIDEKKTASTEKTKKVGRPAKYDELEGLRSTNWTEYKRIINGNLNTNKKQKNADLIKQYQDLNHPLAFLSKPTISGMTLSGISPEDYKILMEGYIMYMENDKNSNNNDKNSK